MWTTPDKIQKLVLDRSGKKISLGAAEGLMIKAQHMILRGAQDRASIPPFTLGPTSRGFASANQREPLYTRVKNGTPGMKGGKNHVLQIWEINEDWVGRETAPDEDNPNYRSFIFFRKEMCLIPPTDPDPELIKIFKRAHNMKPSNSYDPQGLGNSVSRYRKKLRAVDGKRPQVTIPTTTIARERSPLMGCGVDQEGMNSIPAHEAHKLKSYFYKQGEEMALAFDDTCWVFFTQWTKWVVTF